VLGDIKKQAAKTHFFAVDKKTGLVYTVDKGNVLLFLNPKLMILDKKINQLMKDKCPKTNLQHI